MPDGDGHCIGRCCILYSVFCVENKNFTLFFQSFDSCVLGYNSPEEFFNDGGLGSWLQFVCLFVYLFVYLFTYLEGPRL